MKCSVVLATCNGARYIKEQLQSLSVQESLPFELIVGDDASDDNTVEILRAFATTAPFPVYIIERETRLGYALNFSNAVSYAKGDLILFCDQDDIWSPKKLSVASLHFHRNPLSICAIHDISIISSDGKQFIPSYFEAIGSAGYTTNSFVKGCATIITRAFAEAAFPRNSNLECSHDSWVNGISQIAGRRTLINEQLVEHRIHDNNTSGYLMTKRRLRGRFLLSLDFRAYAKMPTISKGLIRLGGCSHFEMRRAVEISRVFVRHPFSVQPDAAGIIRGIHHLQYLRGLRSESPTMTSCLQFFKAWKAGVYRSTGGSPAFFADILRSLA